MSRCVQRLFEHRSDITLGVAPQTVRLALSAFSCPIRAHVGPTCGVLPVQAVVALFSGTETSGGHRLRGKARPDAQARNRTARRVVSGRPARAARSIAATNRTRDRPVSRSEGWSNIMQSSIYDHLLAHCQSGRCTCPILGAGRERPCSRKCGQTRPAWPLAAR